MEVCADHPCRPLIPIRNSHTILPCWWVSHIAWALTRIRYLQESGWCSQLLHLTLSPSDQISRKRQIHFKNLDLTSYPRPWWSCSDAAARMEPWSAELAVCSLHSNARTGISGSKGTSILRTRAVHWQGMFLLLKTSRPFFPFILFYFYWFLFLLYF